MAVVLSHLTEMRIEPTIIPRECSHNKHQPREIGIFFAWFHVYCHTVSHSISYIINACAASNIRTTAFGTLLMIMTAWTDGGNPVDVLVKAPLIEASAALRVANLRRSITAFLPALWGAAPQATAGSNKQRMTWQRKSFVLMRMQFITMQIKPFGLQVGRVTNLGLSIILGNRKNA